jgi:hypothetical protein
MNWARLFLLSGVFVFSHSGRAAEPVSAVWASRFGSLISQISDAKYVPNFPMSSKSRAMIRQELKERRFAFEVPVIGQPTDETLELKFKSRTVVLGFQDFAKGLVTVAGAPIKIEPSKTFLNYRSEVTAILGRKKASAMTLLIPEARADVMRPIDNFIASALSIFGPYRPKDLSGALTRNGDLENTLIDAYHVDAEFWCQAATADLVCDWNVEPDSYRFATLTFTCSKDGHLASVANERLVDDNGRRSSRKYVELTRKGSDQWVRRDLSGEKTVGKSDLNKSPFFKFPQIAERCCAKTGCADRVHSALEGITKEYFEVPQSPAGGARQVR